MIFFSVESTNVLSSMPMPILATSGDGGGGGAVTVMPTRNTKM